MARGKRTLDPISSEEGQPEKKRPALASVIVEALKVDSLQKLCSSLEPILRRVVSEEVERALAKLGPPQISGRVSPKRIEGSDGRNLQLQFRSKLSLPLFTGGKVEGEQGAAIHVVLLDANTNRVVTSGPESLVKLDIVVLEGDFNTEDEDGWTQEEFESHVVKEREGKRPLLFGELQVILKEGVGTLGELTFTDNSSWIRSRKFRLGLKVASGFCEGIRIREAKTDAFTVKDHRGELYKKHYPPALTDEVWRLEKIGKDGSFHKRLNKAGIKTVEDFLRLVVKDSQRLRTILGSGMSNKMWDVLVEHSKTCVMSGKLYVYYPDDVKDIGVVFNDIYVLSGLIANGQYYSADSLSDSQKVFVDTMVKKAYDNWMHVVEYDGKSLLNSNQTSSNGSEGSRSELAAGTQNYSNSFDHHHQGSINSGITTGAAYDNSVSTSYPLQQQQQQQQHMNLNGPIQFGNSSSSTLQNHHFINQQTPIVEDLLALGPPQTSTPGLLTSGGAANLGSFRGFDDFFPEEEIRMRSHEMLENDDMQNLLRIFNMGGSAQTPMNNEDGGYPYSSNYTMNPNADFGFDEDRARPSGKAVVGWLKLKAALRWGIFIRKQAAERRAGAQIVQLDD
jgi:hypothetical protein